MSVKVLNKPSAILLQKLAMCVCKYIFCKPIMVLLVYPLSVLTEDPR